MTNITSRKKTRKFLFQKLFSDTFHKNDEEKFKESFTIDSYKWVLDKEYLSEMEQLIKENEYKLIEILKKYAPKFPPEKMELTYVLPIFIAITEMLWFSWEIPAKVSINEAIELTKIFGTDTWKKIVNWVLNNFYKDIEENKEFLENLGKNNNFSFFKW